MMERLIELVKNNPPLYDNAHEHYGSKDVRAKIWKQITQECEFVDEKAAKAEWKRLRDTFRVSLKAGGARKNAKIWRYSRRMSFLAPFMNQSKESKPEIKTESEFPYYNHILTPNIEDMYSNMNDSEESDSKRIKYEDDRPALTSIDHFFLSICETTKQLPTYLQMQLKRKIFQVVLEAEEEYDQATEFGFKQDCKSNSSMSGLTGHALSSPTVESSTNIQNKSS